MTLEGGGGLLNVISIQFLPVWSLNRLRILFKFV